jgi:hypothetical protein
VRYISLRCSISTPIACESIPHSVCNMSLYSSDDESLPAYILPITYKSGYAAYECAPREVPFSEDYIVELTVGQCMAPDFHIPLALPDGSVNLVGWSMEEPTSDHFLLVDDKVPSLTDVRVFLSDQQVRFRDGFRSVILEAQGKTICDRDGLSNLTRIYRHKIFCSLSRCPPLVKRRATSRQSSSYHRHRRHHSITESTQLCRIRGFPQLPGWCPTTRLSEASLHPIAL